ncbi:protein LURP-one-related 11-like [Asparagus officinalis]|uniref:protein LURP-one-related 11-like n=1 Tax=Asparagus officinalis TaxID=4686 RepID=UPI00098E1DB5|nr:protein LURP-one-related 11-like [Asparagus officinalis]
MWMKSLVLNGNGCTIYNSDGRIVYRVDNYARKSSHEVYLMDHGGRILTKILRKKPRVFGQWEGYRRDRLLAEEQEPWFRVQKTSRILKRGRPFEARVTVGKGNNNLSCYKILGSPRKTEYKIIDMEGKPVAELKRKLTSSGIVLGEDVLTLIVQPNHDQLLITGLVIVCGLINHIM